MNIRFERDRDADDIRLAMEALGLGEGIRRFANGILEVPDFLAVPIFRTADAMGLPLSPGSRRDYVEIMCKLPSVELYVCQAGTTYFVTHLDKLGHEYDERTRERGDTPGTHGSFSTRDPSEASTAPLSEWLRRMKRWRNGFTTEYPPTFIKLSEALKKGKP